MDWDGMQPIQDFEKTFARKLSQRTIFSTPRSVSFH
jgi:hypothetical protein